MEITGLSKFEKAVLDRIRAIPAGRISTYAQVARAAGRPRAFRAVGNALNKNPYAPQVPCHRIIRSDGRLGGYARGPKAKAFLLKKEGVSIKRKRVVNFSNFLHTFASK